MRELEKKKMKRKLGYLCALLLALITVFALTACGGNSCSHRDADDNSLCDKCEAAFSDGEEMGEDKSSSMFTWNKISGGYEVKKYRGDTSDVIVPSTYKGETVVSIGDSAFKDCSILTSVTIPNGVRYISPYAFSHCDNLENVTIPNSITSIGADAFFHCENIARVYISDITEWCEISLGNMRSNPLCCGAKLYLNGKKLTDLVIPDSITTIEDFAFSGCSSIKKVTIPSSVTSIGKEEFCGCGSLTSIKYCGTWVEWNAILKEPSWNYNTGSYTITYNYTGE